MRAWGGDASICRTRGISGGMGILRDKSHLLENYLTVRVTDGEGKRGTANGRQLMGTAKGGQLATKLSFLFLFFSCSKVF